MGKRKTLPIPRRTEKPSPRRKTGKRYLKEGGKGLFYLSKKGTSWRKKGHKYVYEAKSKGGR